jgi:Holliday junction DNA helicase RuvA
MIALLSGQLVEKDPSEIIVDVAGVGYQVFVPVSTLAGLPDPGGDVRLYIHHYVREDQDGLYGFKTAAERRLFGQLLGVSGIGPKVALAILSLASAADIRSAITGGDTAFLASVPGIGKKTAERVVVDLRDKLEMVTSEGGVIGNNDVVQALVGLGYSQSEARKAVSEVSSEVSETDEILREALKSLATKT